MKLEKKIRCILKFYILTHHFESFDIEQDRKKMLRIKIPGEIDGEVEAERGPSSNEVRVK